MLGCSSVGFDCSAVSAATGTAPRVEKASMVARSFSCAEGA